MNLLRTKIYLINSLARISHHLPFKNHSSPDKKSWCSGDDIDERFLKLAGRKPISAMKGDVSDCPLCVSKDC